MYKFKTNTKVHLGSYVRTYPYTPAPVDATHRNFLCAFAHGSFYRMQESLCVAITTTVPHSVCDWALLTVKTVNCWHNDMQDSATTMFMKCKMAGIKSLNAVLRCAKILRQDFPRGPNGRPLHIRGILAVRARRAHCRNNFLWNSLEDGLFVQ